MIKQQSNNSFNDGLMMDMNPLITPNNVMTNCLNGTLVTASGNEYMLQNDMGNGRVETAYLPEGYIPVGTTQLGGIIYIVSYNPFSNLCQIGSFPSPERNFTTKELSPEIELDPINNASFRDGDNIKFLSKQIILTPNNKLMPGDKFIIYGSNITNNGENLSAHGTDGPDINESPKNLKLRIASIDDNGNIIFLKNLSWVNGYYIFDNPEESESFNIDEYRDKIKSDFHIFTTKTSGKLAVIAQLEVINTFSVFWDVKYEGENKKLVLSINWTYENENVKSRKEINLSQIKIGNDLINISDKFNKEDRKNDGTDKPIGVSTDISLNGENTIEYEIIPGMEFGWLEHLSQKISINPKDIGTGKMELLQWKYYGNENSIIISYGLNCNPEKNKKIDNITFNFYKINKESGNTLKDYIENTNKYIVGEDETFEISKNELSISPSYSKKISNRQSYSGYDSMIIDYNLLEKNKCYLVDIDIKYIGSESEVHYHCYKILYTSDIFNEKYITDVDDFCRLSLKEHIKISYKDNINNNVLNIKNPDITIQKYNQDKDAIDEGTLNYIVNGTNTNTLQLTHPIFEVKPVNCIKTNSDDFIFPQKKEELNEINGHHTTQKIEYDKSTINQIVITDKYQDQIEVPYQIVYSEKTNYIPQYQFINLNISTPLILGLIGTKDNAYLVYSGSSFINPEDGQLNLFSAIESVGGDGKSFSKALRELNSIYPKFKQDASGYDVVPIAYCTMHRDKAKHNMFLNIKDRSHNDGADYIYSSTGDSAVTDTTKSIIISYALSCSGGEWNIFNKTINDGSNRIYRNIEVSPSTQKDSEYNDQTTPNWKNHYSGIEYNSINEFIQKAAKQVKIFNNIYRPANENERQEIQANYNTVFYTYNNINTYDNFQYQYIYKVKPSVELLLDGFSIKDINDIKNFDINTLDLEEHQYSYQVLVKNSTFVNKQNIDNNIIIYNRYYNEESPESGRVQYKIINVDNTIKNSQFLFKDIKDNNDNIQKVNTFSTSGAQIEDTIIFPSTYTIQLSGGLLQVNNVSVPNNYVYSMGFDGQFIFFKVIP